MVYKKNLVKGKRYVEFYKSTTFRILEFVKFDEPLDTARSVAEVIPFFNIIIGMPQGRMMVSPRLNLLYEIDAGFKQQLIVIVFRKKFRLL